MATALAELESRGVALPVPDWRRFEQPKREAKSTVRELALDWITELLDKGKPAAEAYGSHLRNRILPAFGGMEIRELKPRHLRAWVLSLRQETNLAPRSIRGHYATLRALCSYALREEALEHSPCNLRGDDLPQNVDADPNWRASAVFEREEAEQVLGFRESETGFKPADRWRVVYALGLLAGLRVGEISALTIGDWHRRRKPLGELRVSKSYRAHTKRLRGTKTGAVISVPVHPALQAILQDWVDHGWRMAFGRDPEPGDLLIPGRTREGGPRHLRQQEVRRQFGRDLVRLGLRDRRFHDTRKTFISLVQADGAVREIVRRATHARKKEVYDGYTEVDWGQLCGEVAKLRLGPPPPEPTERGEQNTERGELNTQAGEPSHETGELTSETTPETGELSAGHPPPTRVRWLKAGRGWVSRPLLSRKDE